MYRCSCATYPDQSEANDVDTNVTRVNVTIVVPPEAFSASDDEIGTVLTYYSTPTLFQLKVPDGINTSEYNFTVDSSVIGLSLSVDVNSLTTPVTVTLQSQRALQGKVTIVSVTCGGHRWIVSQTYFIVEWLNHLYSKFPNGIPMSTES